MLRLQANKRALDLDAYRKRTAQEGDYERLIDVPFELYEGDELKMVYLHLDERLVDLRKALAEAPYGWRGRLESGLKTQSMTFGYLPRHSLFHDYCGATRWKNELPRGHAVMAAHAGLVERYYKQFNPTVHAKHVEMAQRVLPDWRMGNSPFTSGIANNNTPLAYHFDQGNFEDVWSGMITLKEGITGGYLSCPEYNLAVECRDRSLLLFDGQGLLHGVTPITKTKENARRFTVVYYSMRGFWKCLSPGEELNRARSKRDERDGKRARGEGREEMAERAARVQQRRYPHKKTEGDT